LSKEFVRQWLIENGFQGKEGDLIPTMSDQKISEISDRYIELYEQITGDVFIKANTSNVLERIEKNTTSFLNSF
jgi:phosphoribosylaminoimidazole-succinocarboxamide synthase